MGSLIHEWVLGETSHEWDNHWQSHLVGPTQSMQMHCGFTDLSGKRQSTVQLNVDKRCSRGEMKLWTKGHKCWFSTSSSCLALSLQALATSCWAEVFFLFWFSLGPLSSTVIFLLTCFSPWHAALELSQSLRVLFFFFCFSAWQHWQPVAKYSFSSTESRSILFLAALVASCP